jgi:hypothetical protein
MPVFLRVPHGIFPLLALGVLVGSGPALAQLHFQEEGASRGLLSTSARLWGAGAAAADFDDDGDIDLFIPNQLGTADQLYQNQGAGTFVDVAAALGLASTENSRAALFVDVNGNHRLDLIVGGDCMDPTDLGADLQCESLRPLRLYLQQGNGSFVDATAGSGLEAMTVTTLSQVGSLVAGDLNADQYLDISATGFGPSAEMESRIFLNNGDGTFADATANSGISGNSNKRHQSILHDFDGDGDLDMYQCVDSDENYFFQNSGNAVFTDIAPQLGINNDWTDMGVTLGDPDNDADFDIYITTINDNVLYRNDSVGAALAFVDVSLVSGVNDGGWGWGTTFFDADNNGFLDIVATNGWLGNQTPLDATRFFRNQATDPLLFSEEAAAVGLDDMELGSAMVAADFDRDGDLDLVQNTIPQGVRFLDNQLSGGGNWLVVKPRMEGPNHLAIGAVVRVSAGDQNLSRLITAGTSFFGQEPAEAHFGLGATTLVDSVTVEYPGGIVVSVSNVPANDVVTISPGSDSDSDGLLDVHEALVGTLPDNPDSDGDGVGDGVEVGNPSAPFNTDGDPPIDALDADDDGDGVLTILEDSNGNGNPRDDDADGDGIPDYLETDADDDGTGDALDNCPVMANGDQADANADGIGDACQPDDWDEDGWPNSQDNCPIDSNASQADGNANGIGDQCDGRSAARQWNLVLLEAIRQFMPGTSTTSPWPCGMPGRPTIHPFRV